MGLREVFKNAGQTIVKAFGNVPVEVTYTVYGDKSYDRDSDTLTIPSTEYTGIKMFFSSFSDRDRAVNEEIEGTDIKALVSTKDLGSKPSLDSKITVTSSSDITIRSGDTYKIISDFKTDAAEAMYTLHLRAST